MVCYTYVVGDIHGENELLRDLLGKIEQNFRPHDYLVFLGDYIDRGEDSKGVVDSILEFQTRYPKQIICLKGNHEQWFLEAYNDYRCTSWLLGMEGLSTVNSYSTKALDTIKNFLLEQKQKILTEKLVIPYEEFFSSIPPQHMNFFLNLKMFYENDEIICVHAGFDLEGPALEYQTENDILWASPCRMMREWKGRKTLVVGHEKTEDIDSQMQGIPILQSNFVALDTGAEKNGVLSSVRFPDRKVFQVRKAKL